MPSEPGHKRRLVLQWLGGLLLPANIPAPPGSNETTVNRHLSLPNPPTQPSPRLSTVLERKHSQTDDPPSATSEEPGRQLPPTVPQPVAWLKDVDLDQLWNTVSHCYLGPGRGKSLAEITIFGDELPDRIKPVHATGALLTVGTPLSAGQSVRDDKAIIDDASSSDGEVPLNKGFTTLFDTGAEVSVITLKTLRRLKKGYTKLSNLHAEQQSQMGLRDFSGQKVSAVGLVAVIWYLDTFPGAIFNTTFFVVDGDGVNDLIIGKDFFNAVYVAVQEEQKLRNMGPVKRFLKGPRRHGTVALLRKVSTRNLRGRPPFDEVQNRAGGQAAATHFNTGR